jgi:hypothetical protein
MFVKFSLGMVIGLLIGHFAGASYYISLSDGYKSPDMLLVLMLIFLGIFIIELFGGTILPQLRGC